MANDQTRTTPSGTTITEADYQNIKKEATKETLRNVFAMVGIVATVAFVRNRFNIKAVPVTPSND